MVYWIVLVVVACVRRIALTGNNARYIQANLYGGGGGVVVWWWCTTDTKKPLVGAIFI